MTQRDTPVPPIVSIEWLANNLNDEHIRIIDVRPYEQYEESHLPGALHLDISQTRLTASDDATIDAWRNTVEHQINALGLAPHHQVVFYESFSGTAAAAGVWLMDAIGFGNGSLLDGGLTAWHQGGHLLSTDIPSPTPSALEISVNREVLATAGEIMRELDDTSGTRRLVDTRGVAENVAGTIPGSVNIDWTNHIDMTTGALRPLDELAALYADAGFEKDDDISTFCAGGVRASHTYVVLKALGYENVHNYAPSWGEWGQSPDFPIEQRSNANAGP